MYSDAYKTDMAVILDTSSVACTADGFFEINWPFK